MADCSVRDAAGAAWSLISSAATPWRHGMVGLVLVGVLALQGGCRSVWRHSDATQAMFDRDMGACRYGIDPYEQGAYDSAVARGERARRGWKQCMVARGWSTTTEMRGSAPWARNK